MKFVKFGLGFFAVLAILTGAMDVVLGAAAQKTIGVGLDSQQLRDPVLDSQVRFLGGIWLGYGVLMIYCLRQLDKRRSLAQGAMLVMLLGGLGRVLALMFSGMPTSSAGAGFIAVALAIELVLAPVILIKLRRLPGVVKA